MNTKIITISASYKLVLGRLYDSYCHCSDDCMAPKSSHVNFDFFSITYLFILATILDTCGKFHPSIVCLYSLGILFFVFLSFLDQIFCFCLVTHLCITTKKTSSELLISTSMIMLFFFSRNIFILS